MQPEKYNVTWGAYSGASRLRECGSFRGYSIDVVSGYDAVEDRYPVHIYLTDTDGIRTKLKFPPCAGSTPEEAFKLGWAEVDKFFGR